MQSTITNTGAETEIEVETPTDGRTTVASEAGAEHRPPHFWAEYRARRGERIPRSDLRFAMALAGESFCRRAVASEVPFGRGCAEEARGTRGELREALLRLAISGGRAVARELARQRAGALGESARTLTVDDSRLEASLRLIGEDAVDRVLSGRVGFRKAALFEAALRADDPERSEAWVALAAAGAGRVREAIRRLGDRSAEQAVAVLELVPRTGTALVASVGDAHALSPFGAELARAVANAG